MPAHSPQEVHAALASAFNDGDLDALVAMSEEDATHVLPPSGIRVQGKDALRAALEPIFAGTPWAVLEVVGAVESDGIALTHGLWRLELTAPDGGRERMSGRGTIVSRRQPDGTWRIVIDDAMTPI